VAVRDETIRLETKRQKESTMTTNSVDPKAVANGKELSLQLALKGLDANPPAATSFMIGSVSYTLAQLTTKLESMLVPYDQRRSFESQLATVRASIEDQGQAAAQFLRDFRLCFKGMLGAQNQQLSAYGVKPLAERKPLSGEQRVQAADKAKATRQKNGTLGKKQKAELDSGKTVSSPTPPPGGPAKSV
jgi:hypothetical protein